jgi:hypothetical protein
MTKAGYVRTDEDKQKSRSYYERNLERIKAVVAAYRAQHRDEINQKESEKKKLERKKANEAKRRRALDEDNIQALREIQDGTNAKVKPKDTSARRKLYDRIRTRAKKLEKLRLTEALIARMEVTQNGRCGICATPFELMPPRHKHIDHCHQSGEVRGLLCTKCNSLLGFARDDAVILLQAIQYIRRASTPCSKPIEMAGGAP